MNNLSISGLDFLYMLENGAKNLALDHERINSLNVFPVPDGDTGSNMKMTIEGGVKEGKGINDKNIGSISKRISRAMVLSARGNSGVILSQFFKGLSLGLEGYENVDVLMFAKAMNEGTKKAYSVVSNPVEGTMLTVMREAGENAILNITDESSLEEYLEIYLNEANKSLDKTPELLPILKKAGVIDSGGAGFILIIEGMLKALRHEEIKAKLDINSKKTNLSNFNADSTLTYGYCTEFVLQLQNSKVDPESFDLNLITSFLKTIGNSIVSFKDDDLVKVHVHTFDPGIVLTECRKYGEFISLKIENMNVQHSEEMFDNQASLNENDMREHKKYALVAVANGPGLFKAFKEMGVDEVVSGGQTMNTSTEDFIKAFEKVNADNILVYPNNSNIMMAANLAANNYDKANVYVIPTRTIAEGYSAVSMLNYDSDNIEEILEIESEAISNVKTLEVTYSIRDAQLNDIKIKKGDYICIYANDVISCDKSRLEAVKKAFKAISDFEDKQVLTLLCGQDVSIEESQKIMKFAKTLNPFIEVYPIQGDQDIYSYIIGVE